ncbi:hypothetical protein CHUAL_002857 [Chamberlinius hualienensis]
MNTSVFLWFYQLALFLIDFNKFLVRSIILLFKTIIDLIVPPSPKCIEKDIVLITGGGHGLGRELAFKLAALNPKIVLWDINEDTCRKTADELKKLGCSVFSYQCDVSNRAEVAKVSQQVRREVGHPTILINNAGILHCQPLLNLNDQQIDRIVGINLTSHFWTIREFLPSMQRMKKGHIVCISSMAGISGYANLVDYGATKFGVAGLMKHLREELRFQGHNYIHCTTVHPTIINTGMAKKPRINHPWTCPIVETEYAAGVIVDAILRNKVIIFIPPALKVVYRIIGSLPSSVQDSFNDFVSSGLNAHD